MYVRHLKNGEIQMNLYYTDSHGPDQQALRNGFDYSYQLAMSTNCSEIFFGGHTKIQLGANTFENVFGKNFMRSLLKGIAYFNNIVINMFTERINPPSYQSSIIFVPNINTEFLQKLINNNPNASIIYIPWTKNELKFVLTVFPTAKVI